jgi:hypothetical protein
MIYFKKYLTFLYGRHKAEFTPSNFLACCEGDPARKYFYVLENGFEKNLPICCFGDSVSKYHFDAGPFDKTSCPTSCLWNIGFLSGSATTFPNNGKLT